MAKNSFTFTFLHPMSCVLSLTNVGPDVYRLSISNCAGEEMVNVGELSVSQGGEEASLLIDEENDTNVKIIDTQDGYESGRSLLTPEIILSENDLIVLRSNDVFRNKLNPQENKSMSAAYVDILRCFKIKTIKIKV